MNLWSTLLEQNGLKVATGEVARKITWATEEAARDECMINGRQALHIVFSLYGIDDRVGQLFHISDLMCLRYTDDSRMETFVNTWNMMIAGMKEPPPDHLMEEGDLPRQHSAVACSRPGRCLLRSARSWWPREKLHVPDELCSETP